MGLYPTFSCCLVCCLVCCLLNCLVYVCYGDVYVFNNPDAISLILLNCSCDG